MEYEAFLKMFMSDVCENICIDVALQNSYPIATLVNAYIALSSNFVPLLFEEYLLLTQDYEGS